MKALFIGADPATAEMVGLVLRLRWPDGGPVIATTAKDGLRLVEQAIPDLVFLHPTFSDLSLARAVQELRQVSNVPLLVLSHQGGDMELVTALESGADDYVRLPCELVELMARVFALLRRVGFESHQVQESVLRSGPLLLNPGAYEVFLNDRRLMLTTTEYRLLHLLIKNRGIVISHQTLQRSLWGDEVDSYGVLKKCVQRLRRKMGDTGKDSLWVATMRGVGYRFIGPVQDPSHEGRVSAERRG